ncbi:MAG: cobalt transporter CbiM [Actinobacteria bacterium]|nr:cobalt transporter CbiM [Actinomycetota bacterium]
MHIPDGYLGPQTYGAMYAVMTPIWVIAGRKVKATLRAKQVPLLALGAALSFVIMMFNVPVIGGSTGHAVGATVIAIVLGPWAATIAVSLALVIQALLFGDGGITAIAANCFNMAFVMPFVGYYVYRLIAGDAASERRKTLSAGIAGYVSLNVAAISAGVMFGIQPLIAHGADGRPLYAPYPLRVAVPAMALEHLLFFGIVEAIATALIVGYLSRADASLVVTRPAAKTLRWLWSGIAALVLLTPIGALASGTAWGEWNAEELKRTLGFVPAGLAHLEGLWKPLMPDYSIPGISNHLVGYLAVAIMGTAIVAGAAWVLGKVIAKKGEKGAGEGQ